MRDDDGGNPRLQINAQNCVQACPKDIPLTTAIGQLGRQTTVQTLRDLFG